MPILSVVITYFAAMFAFGFGIAFVVPLALAMKEPPETAAGFRFWGGAADLIILIAGGFPVFWILLVVMKVGRKWPEALAKWREDVVVRRHFRVFATAATLAVGFGSVRL